jgi:hypothetical protein
VERGLLYVNDLDVVVHENARESGGDARPIFAGDNHHERILVLGHVGFGSCKPVLSAPQIAKHE